MSIQDLQKNEKIKSIYQELKNIYDKYKSECFFNEYAFNDLSTGLKATEKHLRIIEWNERFGIKLNHDVHADIDYFQVGTYTHMSFFKDAEQEKNNGCGKYISRSDNGKQPRNEWLFSISFPTGAYIFGNYYPTELFEEFFNELKSYKPKYSDTTNKCLYYAIDRCKDIFNNFDSILQKYQNKNEEYFKKIRKKELEEELEKLKNI